MVIRLLLSVYPACAHVGLIFRPQANPSTRSRSGSAERVLVVGLGGGSIPKRFWRDYSDMAIDVAELDPMVEDVAKRSGWRNSIRSAS